MFDVLEHVEDPKATVRTVREALKDDGLFVLSYPDWGSIFARLLKRRWWFLLSVHLYYFTRQTIRRLLERERIRSDPDAAPVSLPAARLPLRAARGLQPAASAAA